MKLNNFKQTNFDITDEWLEHSTDRIMREMMEVQLDEALLTEAGIKDFLQKGAQKIKAVVQKAGGAGEEVYDRLQVKVLDTMVNTMPEVAQKLKTFAGDNKTATAIIAVVGASLMAMEPAAASAAMDTIAQQDPNSIGDAAVGMMSSGGTGGGGSNVLDVVLQQAQKMGADPEEIKKAFGGLEVKGMPVQEYAEKVAQVAAKSKNADGVMSAGTQNILDALKDSQQSGVSDASSNVTKGTEGGRDFTQKTTSFTRNNMDPAMARKLRGG